MISRETLHAMTSQVLSSEASVTPSRIREAVDELAGLPMFSGLDGEDREWVARRIESERTIIITDGSEVVDESHRPWLHGARSGIEWFYWDRYRRHLIQEGWPTTVVNSLDRATDGVLDGLRNPRTSEREWDRRGMVIGHVQSGKTSNYVGLITKAADAGFKVIVVIAGIHEVLRSQTQARIDKGFLGWDTGKGFRDPGSATIGVGRLDKRRQPATVTSTFRDFSLSTAQNLSVRLSHLNEPLILVVKKHPQPLKNFLDWVRTNEQRNGALLMIDDEADNASINIRYRADELSRINEQIREILTLFPRSAYVGYTATPFANIFIDPDTVDEMTGDDLFPRHFIRSLDAPSNYFGADRVFGDLDHAADQPVLRFVDDFADIIPPRHKKHLQIERLPASLVEAIRAFIVACAIRVHRGDGSKHASMLINVSVFTAVQSRVRDKAFDVLVKIRDALRVHGGLGPAGALVSDEIAMLKDTAEAEYGDVARWEEIFPHLRSVADSVDVEEVNSRAAGSLSYDDYEDGRRVIAVGGYSLSRGLTLEGLTTSYFLRNSRMYDTLMQMARWFGYRDGYDDLCRVWMTEEAAGWYSHIANAMDELRADIREMEARKATPMEFGLRVRSHPDALMVTSRNKLGRSETVTISVDLSRSFIETSIIPASREVLASNLNAVRSLAGRLERAGRPLHSADEWPVRDKDFPGRSYLVVDVDHGLVTSFLRGFILLEGSGVVGGLPLVDYIEERKDLELSRWDLLFAGVSVPAKDNLQTDVLGVPLYCQSRKAGDGPQGGLSLSSRHRVASRGVERAGLPEAVALEAEERFRRENPGKKNFPDWIYRPSRPRPLLIVHLIHLLDSSGNGPHPGLNGEPVAAWSISFPTTRLPGSTLQYVLNATALRSDPDLEEIGDEFD